MSLITIDNLEKTFGPRIIFQHASLVIYPGERIGFIGANGAGKTTLFRILAGQMQHDHGTIAIARDVRLGYLPQDPVFNSGNSVIDEAELAFAELHDLSHKLRQIEHEMAELQGEALEKKLRQYQQTQHDFELAGGYAWRHKLEATLLGVGLGKETWEQGVETLSGGQRSRLALAKLLTSEPDVLLLDEPTNHLDLNAIEWLEDYLRDFKGAAVIISHDRFLLDRLCTRVVWLNQCKFDSFAGNYSDFVRQRQLIELTQQRQYEQQQAFIEKESEYIRRFQAGQRARQAKGRLSRLDTLLHSEQLVQRVEAQRHIHLSLETDQRAGDQVLKVKGLSKRYDAKELWREISFGVLRGQRIGIIGPNGSGKTTLLKVLLGMEDADEGDLKWGANLNIGYYDQRLDEFQSDNSVFEEVIEGRDVPHQLVRDTLGALLFRGQDMEKQMSMLSGGERARVRFAQLLVDKPNLLILDEPTNHLDIASCEALETALANFPGTILCVSHDRYFLDRIVQRMLVLQPPGLADFEGNYSAWAKRQREVEQQRAAAAARRKAAEPAKVVEKPRPRKDNPYLRPFGRLSTQELEALILETEEAVAQCQIDFGDAELMRDVSKAKELQTRYEEMGTKLQQLEEEYFSREE